MSNFEDEPEVKDPLILVGIVIFAALGGAIGNVLFPWLFMTYFADHFFHGSRYTQAYHPLESRDLLKHLLPGLLCLGFPGMLSMGVLWTTGAKIRFRATDMIGAFPGAFLGGMILIGVLSTLVIILISGVA